jgi:hypothetical protein
MRILTLSVAMLAMTLILGLEAAPANAQATRTWVSGVGDDANPCSRTAPCKTFAGAISKTATFGEIDCLDPGGFGAVTITKSILIDCAETLGGVVVSGTNAFVVNVGSTDVVTLRGIDVVGLTTGLSGVLVLGGGTVHLEKMRIRGFNSSSAGFGVNFAPSNSGAVNQLFVLDSIIADDGTAAIGGGIQIAPTGGSSANVSLKNVQMTNSTFGMKADGTAAGTINTSIVDSVAAGNRFPGISSVNGSGGTGTVKTMIRDTTVSSNSVGVRADGANVTVFLGGSAVSGNATGLVIVNGGTMNSYKTNQLDNNTTPINGTLGTGTLQ